MVKGVYCLRKSFENVFITYWKAWLRATSAQVYSILKLSIVFIFIEHILFNG